MELVINKKLITTPIPIILNTLKNEIDGKYLKYIGPEKNGDVAITCPWHKEGNENRPSCHIFSRRDDSSIYYGTCHCFTCGKKAPLYTLVGYCLGGDDELGKEWLAERFGDYFYQTEELLPEIVIDKPTKEYLDNSILSAFNYYHPYLQQRGLSKEVCQYFQVGYDKDNDCITFPVWDENNHLVGITRRSVQSKKFILEGNADKPVYLLNYLKNMNITLAYVVESQINCLTLWQWGYPAVALFGTGSKKQYDILKRSGIRSYVLCFDGDDAGRKGAKRFIDNIGSDVFVSVIKLPEGKDVNDLTIEEFKKLLVI